MNNSKYNDFGTKLMNELMVDIIGAVIPGLLFIIVVMLSIVLPCGIYFATPVIGDLANLLKGSGWWVMLIICIIFSYVIGQIFYRADITHPDSKDVMRQVTNFIKGFVKNKHDEEELLDLLKDNINTLLCRFNKDRDLQIKFSTLYFACKEAILKDRDIDKKALFAVLFPEDFKVEKGTLIANISTESKEVYLTYERLIQCHGNDDYNDTDILFLTACYCILYCQMDLGCTTAKRCEFPYLNYYKYLLKRDLTDLLKYVDWHTVEGRTKNKINSLKIKIQIFASEAYALINKNESHVRMASSTWHISRILINITATTSLIAFFGLTFSFNERTRHKQDGVVYQQDTSYSQQENYFSRMKYMVAIHESDDLTPTMKSRFIAFISPFLMLLLVLYIKASITKFIHYQRMREIQYSLQIYEQCEGIIKARQRQPLLYI